MKNDFIALKDGFVQGYEWMELVTEIFNWDYFKIREGYSGEDYIAINWNKKE